MSIVEASNTNLTTLIVVEKVGINRCEYCLSPFANFSAHKHQLEFATLGSLHMSEFCYLFI